MRTALLAAHHLTETGTLRAELLLAGRSVLGWHAALARDLGCERIIVMADRRGPAILAAQHAAEAAGMMFQCVDGFARLPAMITADEDLLVLGDGVIGNREIIMATFAQPENPAVQPPTKLRKAILCLPATASQSQDFPEDFERIDADRCWAGALVMRGAPVQRLGDFPPESNAISLLLRMALQAGTECVMLEPAQSTPAHWVLAHDASALAAHETALLTQAGDATSWHAPGRAFAGWLAAAMLARGLARGEPACMLAAGAALLTAVLLAGLGHPLGALILAAAGSLATDLAATFAAMKARMFAAPSSALMAGLRDPGRDVLASLVLMLALAPPLDLAPIAALGVLAIGIMRIAAHLDKTKRSMFWQDRSVQLAILALAAGLGALAEGVAILALAALAQSLFNIRGQSIPQ